MATTHFHRTVYKSGNRLATGRITYITGAEAPVPVEARIEHQGLAAVTKQRREDLVEWHHQNLPAWARNNPVQFFRAAEAHEGVNRVAYTEWRFSLPRELGRDLYLEAAHDVLEAAFGDRSPYVYAVHAPQASDGGEQPHVHVIWSGRVTDGIARTPETYFRWHNAQHPERGGAMKDPWTYHKGSVKASRVMYTDIMNSALARAGHTTRLHPDRLEARGIARTPEPVALPSDSNKARYKGEITPKWQEVLDSRAERRKTEQLEQAQAQAYWIVRAKELGLTRTQTHDEQRQRIKEARAQRVTQGPTCDTKATLAQLTAEETAIVKLAAALKIERAIEERYAAMGTARPADGVQRMERLLATVGNPQAARRVLEEPERPRVRTLSEGTGDLDRRWGLPLIGNSTSGIYHAYTHKNYGDVHPKNQVHFWTEREAQDAGYRRAANDHYGPGSGQPKTVEEARQRLRQGIDTLTAQQGAFRRVRLRRGQDQDGVGSALRIRLFEEEQRRQERDHGMSL